MKEFLKTVWADIKSGKNLTLYVAVVGSAILFFVRLFGWFEPEQGKPDWTHKIQLGLWAVLLAELLRIGSRVKAAACCRDNSRPKTSNQHHEKPNNE
jgi:hypothetical protein